jgi:hypothetical protein
VEVVPNPADDPAVDGDEVLILASDRDDGLFIFGTRKPLMPRGAAERSEVVPAVVEVEVVVPRLRPASW